MEPAMEVKFYDMVKDELLKFAVILARYEEKWVYCRHKERDTYEIPGGHREANESVYQTAERELREETGAEAFSLEPVCVYSVIGKNRVNEGGEEMFGMLFLAEILSLAEELHSEMAEVIVSEDLPVKWTYPDIQPKLVEEAHRRGYL